MKAIDLKAEIAKVQKELVFFRQACLPAFLDDPSPDFLGDEYAEWVREKIQGIGRLSDWQRATNRLADLLPLGPLSSDSPRMNRKDFREFLFQEATPSFCIKTGKIVWEIGLFMDPSFCSSYCPTCLKDAPGIRRWLMGLPVDSPVLWNGLCEVLPFVVDADPLFAKLALDPGTWRQMVMADPDITEEEQTKRLQLIDGWFGHVLNNALLHVLGALSTPRRISLATWM